VKHRYKECEIQVSLYLAHFTVHSYLHAEHCFVTLSCFEYQCSHSISLHYNTVGKFQYVCKDNCKMDYTVATIQENKLPSFHGNEMALEHQPLETNA